MGKREVKKRAAGSKRWQWWTEDEARGHLEAWRASGKRLSTFAQERGVGAQRLRWWQRRMSGEGSPPPSGAEVSGGALAQARLVPAEVTGWVEMAGATAAVTLRAPGGVVVEVLAPALVSPEWLAAVVSGLRRDRP